MEEGCGPCGPLTVIVAFRSQEEPFAATVRPTLETIAGVLGSRIARLVDIHNRCHGLEDQADGNSDETSCS